MVSITPKRHRCPTCRQRTIFMYGPNDECRTCYEVRFGSNEVISELQEELIRKEGEIADLQTIIKLTEDLNRRVKRHLFELELAEIA